MVVPVDVGGDGSSSVCPFSGLWMNVWAKLTFIYSGNNRNFAFLNRKMMLLYTSSATSVGFLVLAVQRWLTSLIFTIIPLDILFALRMQAFP